MLEVVNIGNGVIRVTLEICLDFFNSVSETGLLRSSGLYSPGASTWGQILVGADRGGLGFFISDDGAFFSTYGGRAR